MDINNVLSRLSKVRKTGNNQWMACCPAHDDKSPSLGINLGSEKITMNCLAGCDFPDVLAAIDLSFTDLYPPRDQFTEYRDKPNWQARGYRKAVVNKEKILNTLEAEVIIYKQMCKSGHRFTQAENDKYMSKFNQIQQLQVKQNEMV